MEEAFTYKGHKIEVWTEPAKGGGFRGCCRVGGGVARSADDERPINNERIALGEGRDLARAIFDRLTRPPRKYCVPIRVQLSRAKGWRMPENTVKVDRSTEWGNPYRVWRSQDERQWYVSAGPQSCKVANRTEGVALAVEKFRTDATRFPKDAASLWPLRGKNLACWCAIGTPCHADVLLELANGVDFDPNTVRPK